MRADGRHRPTTGELARHTGVATSTASEHVGRLLDAGLVVVEAQGRHRYVRLAGPEVARLVEAMAAAPGPATLPRVPAALAFARSCYDHLAGELGVRLCARLTGGTPSLTSDGVAALAALGVADDGLPVRTCLDWSQRRPHVGGPLGARLLATSSTGGWLTRHPTRRRELRLSPGAATPCSPRSESASMPLDLRTRFRELHRDGTFVMPNPWDVGSAHLLAGLGFPALATTSSGTPPPSAAGTSRSRGRAGGARRRPGGGRRRPAQRRRRAVLRRHPRGRGRDGRPPGRDPGRRAVDRGLRPGAGAVEPLDVAAARVAAAAEVARPRGWC